MKKLIIKDKKLRSNFKNKEKRHFLLKTIFQNSNLFTLIRWNAYFQLSDLGKSDSIVAMSPRCVYTNNRKRFNSITPFSRYILLKLIRSGKFSGIKKANW